MSVHIFGIRHHGPGCARSLIAALHELKPDILLIEAPADAQDAISFLSSGKMIPPIALLVYPPDQPSHAVYYPFASFSPEWQALQYGLTHKVAMRFMDMPCGMRRDQDDPSEAASKPEEQSENPEPPNFREDPLQLLAQSAGYHDSEEWWEAQIERRRDATSLFAAIAEVMVNLREEFPESRKEDLHREAYMRRRIHQAESENFQRIAVVCGAWHVPALTETGNAAQDDEILKPFKSHKVSATWIPWTYSRLSYRSGYGAGVKSPGWYEHLWESLSQAPMRWIVRAAHLLRKEDLDASAASVIETVRLAETLAAMRDISMPGLTELNHAIQTVLCFESPEPLDLIRRKLEIGERMGEVPEETPIVPLQKDLEAWQRRLLLKPSPESEVKDLNLREERDRERSRLLHRLNLLGIPWGTRKEVRGKLGTFHELWELKWDTTFIVKLIENNVWGNTIEDAASGYACHLADTAQNVSDMSDLPEQCMLSELPTAMPHVLDQIRNKSAASADIIELMAVMTPLTRIVRYGDVRGTDTKEVSKVFDTLFERTVVGLPNASYALDDEAALRLAKGVCSVQQSLDILNQEELNRDWQSVLQKLLERDTVHGLLRGCFCRLLFDQQLVNKEELAKHAGLNLSRAVPPLQASAWIEGFLAGKGLALEEKGSGGVQSLLFQEDLWRVLDRWLTELGEDTFVSLLPLLRRAFSRFSKPERRKIGEKIMSLEDTERISAASDKLVLNTDRASRVLPILAKILGQSDTSSDRT